MTIHDDETKIFIHPDKQKYTIENNSFAAVEVTYDLRASCNPIIIQNTEEHSTIGSNNEWIKRSFNSRLASVILPDRTVIYTFKEKKMKDRNKYCFNSVLIISRLDGTMIKVYQNGEVIIEIKLYRL